MGEAPKDRVSLIAHRLGTPLTVVASTVGNLLDGTFGALSEEQRRWLQKLALHLKTFETLMYELLREAGGDSISLATPSKTTDASPGACATGQLFDWGGRPPLALIVDDEEDIREVMISGMEMNGFESMAASNGADALRLALERNPDLVLMDVHLEDQNGMDVCRQLKEQLPAFTPVILVTGQEQLRDRIAGKDTDPDDILIKPFQLQELFSRARSMLRLKKLYDELASRQKAA